MRGHVDAESLARCAEGLLSRARAVRIRAHLARCPQCAAEQARLTEVTVLLSEVPAAPLPDFVAARLDAALSAEYARQSAQPAAATEPVGSAQPAAGAPAPGGPGRRSGHRPAGSGWRWPRLPAPVAARGLAAAAVLVVLAGVGYGLAQVTSSPSMTGSSASSASRAAPASSPAVGKAPGNQLNTGKGQQNAPGGGRSITGGQTYFAQSQTNYQAASLGSQAEAVLARHASAPMIPAGTPSSGVSAALRPCAKAVAGQRPVWMVDRARYEGRPALIIVVGTQPTGTVYVTSPGCSARHTDIKAQAPLTGAG
jgi:hypothetical protein